MMDQFLYIYKNKIIALNIVFLIEPGIRYHSKSITFELIVETLKNFMKSLFCKSDIFTNQMK